MLPSSLPLSDFAVREASYHVVNCLIQRPMRQGTDEGGLPIASEELNTVNNYMHVVQGRSCPKL
jgi:hypothetical protein